MDMRYTELHRESPTGQPTVLHCIVPLDELERPYHAVLWNYPGGTYYHTDRAQTLRDYLARMTRRAESYKRACIGQDRAISHIVAIRKELAELLSVEYDEAR